MRFSSSRASAIVLDVQLITNSFDLHKDFDIFLNWKIPTVMRSLLKTYKALKKETMFY